jgi:nitrate/nitrite-specific signal transduction histidine kinase
MPQNLDQQETKKVELDANLKSSYEAITSSLVLFVLCPLEKYPEAEGIVNNDPILTETSKQIIGKNLIEQTKQIQLKKKQELEQRKLTHTNLNSSSNTNGSATKPSVQKTSHQVYQGKELPPNFKSSSSTGGGRSHSNSYFVQLRQFSDSIYHRVQLLSPLYRTTISVFLFTIVFIWWSRRRLISPWFQKYTNSQAKDSNSFLMRVWKSFRPALPPTSGPQSVI